MNWLTGHCDFQCNQRGKDYVIKKERRIIMKKFQVTMHFEMDDEFMSLVPSHRVYVNSLIEKGIVDQYVVSMETQRLWITMGAESKQEVSQRLKKSPIYKYWDAIEIDELFVIDGQHYRLPALQMN